MKDSRFKIQCLAVKALQALLLILFLAGSGGLFQTLRADTEEARRLVRDAIQALGGDSYLNVKTAHSTGRYFHFQRGRKVFYKYFDWTSYDPVKWRFQRGEGKNHSTDVFNLELGKGWRQEGRRPAEPISEDEMREFEKMVRQDLDILLKKRVEEEGMNLFYYGPEDISHSTRLAAVEFLDATNDSVVVYFDLRNHLPVKMETHFTNRLGVRLKRETEFFNWHTIQGVHTPLRMDVHVDGELSTQRFIEKIVFNPSIPENHFLEPRPDRK